MDLILSTDLTCPSLSHFNFSTYKAQRVRTGAVTRTKTKRHLASVNGNGSGRRRLRATAAAAAVATRASGSQRVVELGKPPPSSSALEQLDIERGVCVPFRKYSPQTVIMHLG